ncbi:hypothetical protein UlMin_018717 [Ulmus minor]
MDSQVSRQDDGNNGKKNKNGGQNGGNNNNRGGPPPAHIPRFHEYTPLTETLVARPQPQDNHDLEVRTIMGGPATGETNRARKNYARQSRTDPFPHQVNLTGHKEKMPRLSDDPIIFTEVKFTTVGGIGILRGDQTESREIYEAANRLAQVQGIKSSAKSRDETPTTNIPNKNGSINNSEAVKTAGEHIRNLKETFDILRKYKMKLNPSKCAFGVSSGKFLEFMVNHRGIKANPAKIQALLEMKPPRKIKEDFVWTADCEQSFQDLKSYLGRPRLLSKPHEGDSLILYLAVSKGAVSSALVREEDGVQWLIYYTSKSLLDAETRYPEIENLVLALMVAARNLRPYF